MLMTKEVLSEFAELIRENKCNPYSGNLKTGVDLGTANIVIAVTDEDNHPVAGATAVSKVVKDGIGGGFRRRDADGPQTESSAGTNCLE